MNELNETTRLAMNILWQSANYKITASGLSEDELVAIVKTLPPNPTSLEDGLALMKQEIGEEIFDEIASNCDLISALKQWNYARQEKNIGLLFRRLAERVPDLTEKETLAFVSVAVGV